MGLDILPSSSPNPWLLRSSLVRSSHIPDYRHLPTFSFALQVFAVHLCITLHHIQIVETTHRLHHIHFELLSILFHHKDASALLITFSNDGSPIVRQAQEGQRRSKAAGPGRDDREAIPVTKYGQHSCANARQRYSSIMVTTSITVPSGRFPQLTSRGYQ